MQSEIDQSIAVDLKGSVFTLPVLQIRSTSIAEIELELIERLSPALKFFEHAPVVIDLANVAGQELDFVALLKLLARQNLVSVGVKNGSGQQQIMAVGAGLAIVKGGPLQNITVNSPRSKKESKAIEPTKPEENSQQVRQSAVPTKIVSQPVRSGQQIYAKGGDLILMASVNPGAEIIADGNIHVYAPMKGRALAGVQGDINARIFCQSMQAELIAIAGNFRVFENKMPAEIREKSVQAYLDGEQLVLSPLS